MNTTNNQNKRDQFFMSLKERKSSKIISISLLVFFITLLTTIISCKKEVLPSSAALTSYGAADGVSGPVNSFNCKVGWNCPLRFTESEYKAYSLRSNEYKRKTTIEKIGTDSIKINHISDGSNFTALRQEQILDLLKNSNQDSAFQLSSFIGQVYSDLKIIGFSTDLLVPPGNTKITFPPNGVFGLNQFILEENWIVAKNGKGRREILVRAN